MTVFISYKGIASTLHLSIMQALIPTSLFCSLSSQSLEEVLENIVCEFNMMLYKHNFKKID